MEAIKAAGTYFVSYIQKTWLVNYAYKLHQTTHYASPGFLLTIACPILFALQGAVVNKSGVTVDSGVAHAVLWTVLVGIRFNIIKQWSFGEDRPFWRALESSHFTGQRIPDLRQFPVTCLTSPAAPLFTLLAAGAGFVIVNAAVKVIKSIEFKNAKQRRWIVMGTWLSFGVFVGSVAEAEMLFLTNFPHQVAISLAIGLSIGYVATRRSFSRVASIKKILLVNLVVMALCYLTLWRGEAIATFNDYQKLVFKWCQRREWMQIDPSPLLDSFLYTGYAIGAELLRKSSYYKRVNKPKFTYKMIISLVILNLGAALAIALIFDAIPKTLKQPHVYAWYAAQLVGGILIPYSYGAVVPYFVQKVSGVPPLKIVRCLFLRPPD